MGLLPFLACSLDGARFLAQQLACVLQLVGGNLHGIFLFWQVLHKKLATAAGAAAGSFFYISQ